jgi:hypothetical protein
MSCFQPTNALSAECIRLCPYWERLKLCFNEGEGGTASLRSDTAADENPTLNSITSMIDRPRRRSPTPEAATLNDIDAIRGSGSEASSVDGDQPSNARGRGGRRGGRTRTTATSTRGHMASSISDRVVRKCFEWYSCCS